MSRASGPLPTKIAQFDFGFALGDPGSEARELLGQMGLEPVRMHAKASR